MVPSQTSGATAPPGFNRDTLAGLRWCLEEDEPGCWQRGPLPPAPRGTVFLPRPKNTALEASPDRLNRCHPHSIKQAVPLTAAGTVDLEALPGDPGRARLPPEACGRAKALAGGGGAGAGAGPGQPAPRLLNNLIGGGLASSPPLPILEAVCSGRVERSGRPSSLGRLG